MVELMDINNISHADILISAVRENQYPNLNLPEVALAGRSNVGKSSFINSMINRKKLARTSSKPGKTRTINFFNIEDNLLFVDVPGYGYAKVSKTEQEKWAGMMEQYFSTRQELRLVVQIVDLRHKPSQQDVQMYEYLSHFNLPVLVIATKADKVKASKRHQHKQQIIDTLDMYKDDHIVIYSSETKEGKIEAWDIILDYCKE